jgi:hypothetical protein
MVKLMNEVELVQNENWIGVWGADWVLAGCASCNGVFVLPPEKVSQRCPFCGQATLAQMNPADDRPIYTQPPELIVPFTAAEGQLRASVRQFAKSLWLAPADLSENTLLGRLQPVYLPMWLVDAQVQGEWQAEMGFDYEIVSHRERFNHSDWQTERVKEKRVRWEQRVGRLQRQYDNQAAPALEEQARVEGKVGRFDRTAPKPFHPGDLHGAVVHLPNRPPTDAWNEAVVGLQTAVAQDCRLACEADHSRGFKWSPRFANQQWTQLLLPLYTSYYLDDDNRAQMVLLHGQTGKLHGTKHASMKRAQRVAGMIAAAAAVFLLLTLALMIVGFTVDEAALAWAGVAGVLTAGVGGTAVIPLLYAWYINTTAKQ